MSFDKNAVRLQMLQLRDNGLLKNEKIEKSSQIVSQFINDLLLPARVKSVGLYYPVRNEVDTIPIFDFCLKNSVACLFPRIISDTDMIFLPVESRRNLVRRKFGIYEPGVGVYEGGNERVPEIIIVPGVVFDTNNNRIGYGKGYYDRFLSLHNPLLTVGLCYQFQVLGGIDPDDWDKRIDLVLTEKGWQGDIKNIFAGGSR